jgi:hypothetical protein
MRGPLDHEAERITGAEGSQQFSDLILGRGKGRQHYVKH